MHKKNYKYMMVYDDEGSIRVFLHTQYFIEHKV